MLSEDSIYLFGEPNCEMADELLQADTKEKLEKFAKEYPSILLYSVKRYIPLTLKDFNAMRTVLVKALEFATAADDCSLHNPESLKEIGINITRYEEEYLIGLNIQLEQCEYKKWIEQQENNFITKDIYNYPTMLFSEDEVYEYAAKTAFDEIVSFHLRNVHLISSNKKMGFSLVSNSIEALWLGVLEKSSGKDSYIGICKNCGKPFFAEKARSHKREFCNNGGKCKDAYNNKRKAEKRKEQNNGKNEK